MTSQELRFVWRRPIVRFQWAVTDNVWPLTVLAIVALTVIVVALRPQSVTEVTGILAGAGAVFATLAFLHKHSLESEREFLSLFRTYNGKASESKIGGLADRLKSIENVCDLNTDERKVLEAYLDICAEEYFLYLNGRIHPSVCRTWLNGILNHISNSATRHFLSTKGDDLYYGMTVERLERLLGRSGSVI